MSNTFFSFKQFTVQQDKCAMKVCTDACLFGAWAIQKVLEYQLPVKNILDIGGGTGLLSLMLAQNFTGTIDTVEIDARAAQQAKENCDSSPWQNIRVHHSPIADFIPNKKYDLIISNPPFYEGNLVSPDINRTAAMHNSYLSLEKFLQSAKDLIGAKGYVAVLLPFSRKGYFLDLLIKYGFHAAAITDVRPSHKHGYFRVMLLLSPAGPQEIQTSEISVHDEARHYTKEFSNLLKDYYLAF